MITTVAVAGYRSLRDVTLPLHRLTLVRGENGVGKSSLYRALRLLAGCARGEVVATLAREGGLQSALWAGPATTGGSRRGHPTQGTVRSGPVSLLLGFASTDARLGDLGYLADLGLPQQTPGLSSAFLRDPELKREVVFTGPVMRPATVLARRRWNRVDAVEGRTTRELTRALQPWQSMVSELADPDRLPELLLVRQVLSRWRFYDAFRADAAAPARQPQVGTRTPVLSDDGSDLAAAVQTIREFGHGELDAAVDDAFPGARLEVEAVDGRFELLMHQPGMLRPLRAAELSDGTLRYLLWLAALLCVDPPTLMVLNEPETSLHPDLVRPLGRLVRQASQRTQVLVISHSDALAGALQHGRGGNDRGGNGGGGDGGAGNDRAGNDRAGNGDAEPGVAGEGDAGLGMVTLAKRDGETVVQGQGLLTRPAWEWGSRR